MLQEAGFIDKRGAKTSFDPTITLVASPSSAFSKSKIRPINELSFSYCCYLSDLAVDPDYQRQGIGKELIRLVSEAIGDESMLLLLSAPTAHSYYPYIGFEKLDTAWNIPRKR
jgi:predicted N-acetyltransferase YhbS